VNIADVTKALMDNQDHLVETDFGTIRGRIKEVGGDKMGLYVGNGNRILYLRLNNGISVHPKIDGRRVTVK
jgi:hypothetical protein